MMPGQQYKDSHKYFLHAIMNRCLVSELECQRICQQCCSINNEHFSGDIKGFLEIVNKQIRSFHFEVKESKREDNGDKVYVLVSLVENDLNRLVVGGDFTRQELELFKKIVELIILSDSLQSMCRASSTDILNLADTLSPKMTKVEAKKLLERFVDERWFYNENGMVALSPRAILELEEFISRSFQDFLKTCKMCERLVFHGQACQNCQARMHHTCASRYFLNTNKCLNCNETWPDIYQTCAESNGVQPMVIAEKVHEQPVTSRKRRHN